MIRDYIPQDHQQSRRLKFTLATATGAGGMLSEANPFGADLMIDRVILDVTTQATGAATANVGVDADGATGDDTLIDGVDIGTAPILTDNLLSPGINGKPCVKWGASQYLVMSGVADPAGLVGTVYVDVHKL